MLEIVLFAYLPALLGMLVIALSVLVRQRRPAYISFALVLFSVILWLGLQALSTLIPGDAALLIVRLSIFVSNFMAPLFLLFAIFYPSRKEWLSFKSTFLMFIPSFLFAGASFLPGMVESAEFRGEDLVLKTGLIYDMQTIFVVVYMLASLSLLVWKYFHVPRHERVAILMLFIAFLFPLVIGILMNYVLINNPGAQYFLPATLFITALIIAYAMVKHRLFDIRLAAVRGAVYILSLATLAGLYYIMAYVVSELILNRSDGLISASPLSIALALVLAFIFQPVRRFFDKLTNSIFFHDNYDLDDFLERLGHELSTSSDLRNLLHRASKEISGTLQGEQGFFFVRYGEGHQANAGTDGHARISAKEVELLDSYVRLKGSAAIITDILSDSTELYRLLSERRIAIVLPLLHEGKPLNYLFIGRRLSREYSRRDVRVLETIANELMIAIQNALSVQEVKDINATLQQRIDDATKELRATNKQLQHLDEIKDEFVSMASHQLRTPLTSVKGYISMVLEGDAGRITSTQRQLLEEAFTSSERMVHLIGDFLNVSRLQTGKFMIDKHPIDLAKVIGQEVDSLQTTAKAHDLRLEYRAPSYFPTLYIDEGKIRQVVMNFIDNAIYYSREDSAITVELSVIDGNAVLQVHDTGIGVPKSEQAHLFSKFFRATNARKQRPDGTGVGLYLAKKVVTAHSGTVLFESVEGVGSTFGFRLPIKKLSNASADDADQLE